MRKEESKSEISVPSYIWKSSYYVTGHYEFEINIKYTNTDSNKTIYRRFSDIEWLHDGLLAFNPGCRIPNMPEKSIWCNIGVNNNVMLDKRKKLIENYLSYINSHKFLKFNTMYQIFISDDFEKIKKNEYSDNKKSHSIYNLYLNLKNQIPGFKAP